MKNHKLRDAIFEAGISQRTLSDRTGIPESYISYAIHGRFNLDIEQQEKICRVLGKERKELFGDGQ